MIYKFKHENGDTLEIESGTDGALITVTGFTERAALVHTKLSYELDLKNLYDLIGALHSIQTKIKNAQ